MSYVEALLVEAMEVCDWVLKEGRFSLCSKVCSKTGWDLLAIRVGEAW